MKKNSEIEELIYEETEKRLEEMQDPAYEYPKRITKGDVIGIISLIVVSLTLIISCMMGVIK